MSENLTSLATLVELAEEPSSEKRRELLRNVTDLFFNSPDTYNPSEIELFGDVMGTISSDLETEIRQDIAERMAELPNPPMQFLNKIAHDEISVAAPVLSKSPALDDDTLIDIAKNQSQDHILAMTKREEVSENLSASIVENGDDNVVASLLENEGATINRPTMEQVVERASTSEVLHKPIVNRSSTPADLLNEMFFVVSSELKAEILEKNENLDESALDEVIGQSHEKFAAADNAPKSPAEKFIDTAEENRELTEGFLVDLLRNRSLAEFLFGFARLTGMDVKTSKRILQDRSAEALAIACKASRFDRATFSTIVLLTDVNQHRTPDEVNGLMDLYTQVSIQAAQRTMRFWRVRQSTAQSAASNAA